MNINEAWKDKHSIQWKQATHPEFAPLQSNDVWDLVPMSKDKNFVGCRWIFKVKRNSAGSLHRFKRPLFAQGFTQQHGIDYKEVFAPSVYYRAVRSLLALINKLNLEVLTRSADEC